MMLSSSWTGTTTETAGAAFTSVDERRDGVGGQRTRRRGPEAGHCVVCEHRILHEQIVSKGYVGTQGLGRAFHLDRHGCSAGRYAQPKRHAATGVTHVDHL